jgi:hypothetical protein
MRLIGMRLEALLVASTILAGCSPTETTQFSSPDGKLVASLVDERGGGAATSAYQTVEIVAIATGERLTVFEGENMGGRRTKTALFGDINVSWQHPRVLLIEFCGGAVRAFARHFVVNGMAG